MQYIDVIINEGFRTLYTLNPYMKTMEIRLRKSENCVVNIRIYKDELTSPTCLFTPYL